MSIQKVILALIPLLWSFDVERYSNIDCSAGKGRFDVLFLLKDLVEIRDWSLAKSEAYFPGQTGPGEIGDAYRHVLASVISRKVVGRTVASSAGWVNELLRDVRNTNTPQDRFMDLHNNKVGRHTAYHRLIGSDWEETALNVKAFMKDENNALVCNWGTSPPIRRDAKAVHRNKENQELYLVYGNIGNE